MSAVVVAVNITGTPDTEDRQAHVFAIDLENARRLTTGEAQLPKSTAAERRASMETILGSIVRREYGAHVQSAADKADQDSTFQAVKVKWNELTPTQRASWLAFNP